MPRVQAVAKNEQQAALRSGTRPLHPAEQQTQWSKAETLAAWTEVAKNLSAAGEQDLARDLAKLMRSADKPETSKAQELYDLAKSQRTLDRDHEHQERRKRRCSFPG